MRRNSFFVFLLNKKYFLSLFFLGYKIIENEKSNLKNKKKPNVKVHFKCKTCRV